MHALDIQSLDALLKSPYKRGLRYSQHYLLEEKQIPRIRHLT